MTIRMSRIIAYDFCRLFIGPNFATPRGIDRIDLAMAKHLFSDPASPHIAILPTPLGVRAYPASVARSLLSHLEHLWKESLGSESDPRLHGLIASMRSPRTAARAVSNPNNAGLSRSAGVRRSLALVHHLGVRLGQTAGKTVPADAVYANFGQLALAMPNFFNWLDRRPDIACVLMIHDTIPLDHPELVKPGSAAHHARMVRTAATHADGLIFSTAYAKTSVDAALAQLEHSPVPSMIRSLPIPSTFAKVNDSLPDLADTHYFVVVSTIERRKNFSLLIRVWEQLTAELGERAPHLVMVGAPGLDAEYILSPLSQYARLRERVHHVSGLSSPALARLVLGAAALLSPSFAEGFGLPLLEGIAMGVPTIASDIPSHREIARGTTTLLGVEDQAGWTREILTVPRVGARRSPKIPAYLTEAAYCADITAFLNDVVPQAHAMKVRTNAGVA
jgi:glycosyltransferase involved in cell wall biosynthesis